MKKNRLIVILGLLALALLLSGCAGGTLGPSNWPGVMASENVAYLAQGSYVYAINLSDGALKWKYPVDKPNSATTFYAAPVMTPDGQLLAASYDHKLYSLDPETGALKWSFEDAKDIFVGSPLVTEKGIYAPNADGNLYAIDFTGQKLWSFETSQHLWGTPISDEDCGCIYLPGMDHKFYAIDAESGTSLWESEDLGGALIAQPVYANGTLYVGTFASEVLALNAVDGSRRWTFETGGWVFGGGVLVDDLLVIGDLKNNLYGLDAKTGEQIWNKTLEGPIYATPLVKDGVIYVTIGNESVYAFKLDGNSEWSQDVVDEAIIQGSIVDGGELILVPTSSIQAPLVALNPNGTTRWVFSVPK